jgi:hypothetical protein
MTKDGHSEVNRNIFATFQFNSTVPSLVKLGPSLYDETADVRVNTVVSPSVLSHFFVLLILSLSFFLLSPFVPHLRVSFQSSSVETQAL